MSLREIIRQSKKTFSDTKTNKLSAKRESDRAVCHEMERSIKDLEFVLFIVLI